MHNGFMDKKELIQNLLDLLSDEVQALPGEDGVVTNYGFSSKATSIVEDFTDTFMEKHLARLGRIGLF